MQLIRFYLTQTRRHHGVLLYEWLLKQAHAQGASGATAFHALAGFGRHGWHEATFFELAGDVPVAVEVIASDEVVARLIAAITAEQLSLPYLQVPVALHTTGDADQSSQ
ncbi:DUF190 domain-containing protein [Jeongeupia naejangsanensis]|uniref:DUF190 domain-containing protein n=1 Tax=Jeongeupia naejangsanensis TaxID=613195 RepID=A0ABS2BHA4_9NEIS|nr:DUF190 domain-containing protein [Jeongeupia naejangsanensis]MBM3114473.1 DUF190 domain-containing protein [Jeongeupia naejangsanensis]